MQAGATLRQYENRILQISQELEAVNYQRDQLTTQHEQVKKLLSDSNIQLQAKSKQLNDLKKSHERLKRQKQQCDYQLRSSQHHRKTLFDQMVTTQRNINMDNRRRDALLGRLKQLNQEFIEKNDEQMKKIIEERNGEIKKLSNQYNQLIKEHIKCTNQYYQKMSELREENEILKKSNKIKNDIEEQFKKVTVYDYTELSTLNRTLNERLNIMQSKLSSNDLLIRQLRDQLEDALKRERDNQIKRERERRRQNRQPLDTQDIIKMMDENEELKQLYIKYKNWYEKIINRFPYLQKNQRQFIAAIEHYQNYTKLISEHENLKQQRDILKQKYGIIKTENQKLIDEVKELKIINQKNKDHYEKMSKEFKDYLKQLTPYYDKIDYLREEFQENEKRILKRSSIKYSGGINSIQELIDLRKKATIAQQQLAQNRICISRLKLTIANMTTKMKEMEIVNNQLGLAIQLKESTNMTDSQQQHFESLMEHFSIIQQQRNMLKVQLRDRQIKIIQLMVELNIGSEQSLQHRPPHLVLGPEFSFNACRPTLLSIDWNKDANYFLSKFQQFHKQIETVQKDYQFNLRQIKSEFQTQIAKLKQKIIKLEDQKKQLSNAHVTVPVQQNMQQQQIQERMPIHEGASILQLGQDVPFSQNQQSQNLLNTQSIESINKILSVHQINLKMLMDTLSKLRDQYKNLDLAYNNISQDQLQQQLQKDLSLALTELKAIKVRLNQSDRNVLHLQKQLQQKEEQIKTVQNAYKQQITNLNKTIQLLQKQIHNLSHENWYDKQSHQSIKQKKLLFPEQIQYLIELVIQKNKQLKSLKQKEQRMATERPIQTNLQLTENSNSDQMNNYERQQIAKLFKSAELLNVLNTVTNKLIEMKNSQV